MYLMRLRLDARSARVRRDIGDAYEMHRTLVRAFVTSASADPPRILWRLEPTLGLADPVVLIQSEVGPDESALSGLPNYLKRPPEIKQFDIGSFLCEDELLRFRLFANPTVTREGKRQGLVGEAAQLAWLGRQGERQGFALAGALVTGSEVLQGRKGDHQISVLMACFEGRLKVNDPIRLAQAVVAGIGPAKAFGCGMLSLGRD